MNILIVTPAFPPDIGGPATYSFEILKRLEEGGHNVKVITSAGSTKTSDVYVVRKKRVKSNNAILKFSTSLYNSFFLFFSILKSSKKTDIIFAQTPLLGFVSIFVGKLLRKPVVLKFVGDSAWERAFNRGETEKYLEDFLKSPEGGVWIRLLILLQKFVFKKVDKIIVPSRFLKDILVSYYCINPKRVRVIYNSIDITEYSEGLPEKSQIKGNPKIVTIGRLVSHKRVDGILRTVEKIAKLYLDMHLLIVGDGPEKEKLKMLSEEIGLEDKVTFLGRLNHEDTIALLREADIFVLNSVYEGLPHVVIEAMACRTPVIATNIRGTNEVVKDGETGLLVSPNKNEELKEKIIQLLRDEGLRKKLVENAYKSVKEKFTWEKNLHILEKKLEEVMLQ